MPLVLSRCAEHQAESFSDEIGHKSPEGVQLQCCLTLSDWPFISAKGLRLLVLFTGMQQELKTIKHHQTTMGALSS